ncbi:MAG: arginine decarboxylase, partial [Gammaproteobacteria bacterium]|nr:arginine decarboxylase [Gammaproteobacteria bacterium]
NEKLADKYFCNFSLFQSVPDVWAIDQVFPIVPIHRLDEEPTQRGVINDITCDSDGRFDYYVDRDGIESTVALHSFKKSEPYLIGIFMVGAYQEILGDMHNLFGDTHSINIEVTSDGNYKMVEPLPGDNVDDVLRYVHLEPDNMLATYQQKVSAANLDATQKQEYLKELEAGLSGYTYLEE